MGNPFGALLKLILAGSMTAGAALAIQDRADPWLEQPDAATRTSGSVGGPGGLPTRAHPAGLRSPRSPRPLQLIPGIRCSSII